MYIPKKIVAFVLAALVFSTVLGQAKIIHAAEGESFMPLRISQVQITGGVGKTSEDFIELFNPNEVPLNLNGYRLVKRSGTGATDASIKSWDTDVFIPARSFFLWANSSFVSIPSMPDAVTSSTLADNNGVAVRFGASDTGTIVDSVSWGTANNGFVNVSAENPTAAMSLLRSDLETASSAFTIAASSARNSSMSVPVAYPTPYASPYATPYSTPYVTPESYPTPYATPESYPTPYQTPYSTPYVTPYGTPYSTPYQTPYATPYGTPYQTPYASPYATPAGPKITSNLVIVTEILPNPAGVDAGNEKVELQNNDPEAVNITGWFLDDKTAATVKSSAYKFPETVLLPGQIIVVSLPKGKVSLNNNGDEVRLYDSGKKLLSMVSFGDGQEGESYQLYQNSWVWNQPTFGTPNTGPVIIDEPEDEEIEEGTDEISGSMLGLRISEVLPSPQKGSTEFIELYNDSADTVQLAGGKLLIGTKTYLFEDETLGAGEFLLVSKDALPIQLRNTGQTISLYDDVEQILDTVEYPKAVIGQSYALFDDEFAWTITPTPASQNQYSAPKSTAPKKKAVAKKAASKVTPAVLGNSVGATEGPRTKVSDRISEALIPTAHAADSASPEKNKRKAWPYVVLTGSAAVVLTGCAWLLKTSSKIVKS